MPTYQWNNRPIKVIAGDKAEFIRSHEELCFSVEDSIKEVTVKIDYYKTTLRIKEGLNHLILSVKGETPMTRIFYQFTTRALKLEPVCEQEYQNFDANLYTKFSKFKDNMDTVNILANAVLAFIFAGLSFLFVDEDLREFLFFLALLGLTTLAVAYFDRKALAKLDAYTRIMITNICYMGGVIWLSMNDFPFAWILALLVIFSTFRTIRSLTNTEEIHT